VSRRSGIYEDTPIRIAVIAAVVFALGAGVTYVFAVGDRTEIPILHACPTEAQSVQTAVYACRSQFHKWPGGIAALVKSDLRQSGTGAYESPTNVTKKNAWYYAASSHRVVSNCTEKS
jgi:hypothetical protein